MAQLGDTFLLNDINLQGYWPCNGNFNDRSINGYNLTAVNSPTFVDGKYIQAGSFVAASSQYAEIANASCPNLEITGSQTWSCWLKPTSLVSYMYPMSKAKSDGSIVHCLIASNDSSGLFYFSLSGLTTNTQVASVSTLVIGSWQHIVGVYDSSATTLAVYYNGVLDHSITASGSATNTTGNFALATQGSQHNQFSDGLIDDAAIFNRALNAREINNLYRTNPNGMISTLQNLV